MPLEQPPDVVESGFESLWNNGLDPKTTDPSVLRRVRVITGAGLAMFAIGAPFVVQYWQLGLRVMALGVACTIVAGAVNISALRKNRRPYIAGQIGVSMLYLLLLMSNITSGGFYDPNFAWLYVVPIAAAILVNLRACWAWTGVIVATTVAFWALTEMGWVLPSLFPADNHAGQSLFNRVSAILGVAALSSVFVLGQRTTEERLARLNAELRRESALVRLLHEVTSTSNAAMELDPALINAVSRICEITRWPIGMVYLPSEDGRYALSNIRHTTDPDMYGDLIESLPQSLEPRSALVLRAVQTGHASWTGTLSENSANPLYAKVVKLGATGAIAVPVVVESETVGVLQFFTDGEGDPDERLLEVLGHIGKQLGRVVERRRNQDQIRNLAYYDGLTGLPNRAMFSKILDLSLAAGARHDRMSALLFLDLDRFKHVNDTLGHAVGDELLKQVSARFKTCVRDEDVVGHSATDASISRLGGDEFTVVLTEISRPQDAGRVATRMIQALEAPFQIGEHQVYTGASIGVAVAPSDGQDATTLIRNADTAMYHAKSQGSGKYAYYSPEMNASSARRMLLENQLRTALLNNEFQVHYQPIVFPDGSVAGLEALIRWFNPYVGRVGPDEFIPVTEETGMIREIGAWVLEQACQAHTHWRSSGLPDFRMSVNVSSIQLLDASFPDKVAAILSRTGIRPSDLELELTESAILEDAEVTRKVLFELDALGIPLCLDDFGTGYSSLAYLRRYPLARVKIDRSFVSGVPHDIQDCTLTKAVVALAASLDLQVVAEGVETPPQRSYLKQLGCQELQGWLFGKPQPFDEMTKYLNAQLALAS